MTAEYQISLPLKSIETAEGDAVEGLRAAQKAMGFIPNMYGAMANAPALFALYNQGYARFRAESGFTAIEQEVVLLVVSRGNACGYCMSAHSFVADAVSKVPPEVTNAIRDGKPIADARLQALASFTQVMFDSRGKPTKAQAQAFLDAGFSERQMLEVILAIAVKTLSNYTNHLFHTPLDQAFAGRKWQPATA
jgi:uncharacterized peroxidase-related enzyme